MAGRLSGKVALITGGASGIGKACALRFAEEGADVVIADLVAERCEAAAADVQATTNGRALWVEANVTDEESVETMAQRAMDELGRIDCAVAAAGVSHAGYVSGELAEEDSLGDDARHLVNLNVDDWNQVLAVNLTGVMLSIRTIARHMITGGNGGSIVNIASSAARIPLPGGADYCVSKAGVAMLTQVAAAELVEHRIRVNAIGPGFIETPMTQAMQDTDEGTEMMLSMTPMGRLGTPVEMANTALYLASDESSYTTGQTIYPNGGIFYNF